jgi:hypothetical protein
MGTTTASHPDARQPAPSHTDSGLGRTRSLGQYVARDTKETREVVSLKRQDGSSLVVDYRLGTLSDGRLIAHLAPDEPTENARILCEMYLADDARGRCRAVTPDDFDPTPQDPPPPPNDADAPPTPLHDVERYLYEIREVATDGALPELRWTRCRNPGHEHDYDVLTLRDVVARLETYEPATTRTRDALTPQPSNRHLSTHCLQAELDRLVESPIVLNRALREAVQRKVRRDELSMSEIAMRCGRVKRDRRGNTSGETSWLARRIGQLPEGGSDRPGPWIHSDVLALIARDGLGTSPLDVEVA